MAADCKSALLRVRWFESSPLHQVKVVGGFMEELSSGSGRGWAPLLGDLNGRAEAFQAYDEGSIPFTRSRVFVGRALFYWGGGRHAALVAQW